METRPELPDTSESSRSVRNPAEARTNDNRNAATPDEKMQVSDPGVLRISGRTLPAACLVALIVVLVLYLAVARPGSDCRKLAQDLAACGWVLDARPGCGFCDLQMRILGAEGYPKLVCCGPTKTRNRCASLRGFPCWINEYTHEERVGLLNRTQLKQMCGGFCA